MAQRKKGNAHGTTRTPIPDKQLIARLEEKAPEVLTATIPEAVFDAVVQGLLDELPGMTDNPHFYCRKCSEYHLKNHPHYRLKRDG